MKTRRLTKAETEQWESRDAREREGFRAAVREELTDQACPSEHCEVYSHDGITLDAWAIEVQA